ncbi:hypothetical protein Cni_G19999 [Canna indica]|uniref:CCHC-type domain-containing protein n=1 Tax=Canna indica TaxID=4628 RepID=A0AAQ3KSN6_9LILI|nr:hypothetical protein Cni_G19999 [Canna indica]
MEKKLLVFWANLLRAANVSDNLPKKNDVVDRIRNIQESSMDEVTSEDELISARKEWSLSLYGKFYGRSPTLGLVQFMMPKIWKTNDGVIVKRQRAKYARVCVLWDLTRIVPNGIWVKSSEGRFWQAIAVENIPKLCYQCEKIGHTRDQCVAQKGMKMTDKTTECTKDGKKNNEDCAMTFSVEEKGENVYGPWQIVRRKRRGGFRREVRQENSTKNSFGALKEEEKQNYGAAGKEPFRNNNNEKLYMLNSENGYLKKVKTMKMADAMQEIGGVRKAAHQMIFEENFPFNLKQSRGKKKRYSNADKMMEPDDGDPLVEKDRGNTHGLT